MQQSGGRLGRRQLSQMFEFVKEFIKELTNAPSHRVLTNSVYQKTLHLFFTFMHQKPILFQASIELSSPLQHQDARLVFTACFFLICKDEKCIESFSILAECFQKTAQIKYVKDREAKLLKAIVDLEFQILRTMGFDLAITTPAEILEQYQKVTKISQELSDRASRFLNYNLMGLTNLTLFYQPEVLLVAAIEASIFCVPRDKLEDEWWTHPLLQGSDPAQTYQRAKQCITEFNRLKKI